LTVDERELEDAGKKHVLLADAPPHGIPARVRWFALYPPRLKVPCAS